MCMSSLVCAHHCTTEQHTNTGAHAATGSLLPAQCRPASQRCILCAREGTARGVRGPQAEQVVPDMRARSPPRGAGGTCKPVHLRSLPADYWVAALST